ncbi:MAG: DNA polymerase III subunit gamma/tau, partial [Sciscionella sp.]|nr:DNA polymerase III subunit gamma/tau [Sciscionella sp.]
TTEPDKVLPTIRSRTHHYPFRLIPPNAMRALLESNCAAEGISVEPAVFPLVIRAGGGSARDTQSVLDQLLAGAGDDGVTYRRAVALLGVTDATLLDDLVDGLAADDAAAVFGTVQKLIEAGHDPRRFAADLLDRLRDLVLLRAVPDAAAKGLIAAPDDELARMTAQAGRIGPATLTRYAEIVHNGLIEMRGATSPRLLVELLCARMLLPATDDASVLQRMERLERRANLGQRQVVESPAKSATPQKSTVDSHRVGSTTVSTVDSQPSPRPPVDAPPVEETVAAQAKEPAIEPATEKAPASELTTSTDTVDAVGIRRVFAELLSAVRKHSRSVEAMMSSATVASVVGNEVTFTHPAAPLVRRLSEQRNTDTVADALHAVFDGQWKVRWEHGEAPASDSAATSPSATSPSATSPSTASPATASPAQEPGQSTREPSTRAAATAPASSSSTQSSTTSSKTGQPSRTEPTSNAEPVGAQGNPTDQPDPLEVLTKHLGARKLD